MSNVPDKLRYTEDHEWVLVSGGIATVGVTDHAQDQLGDIVYLGDFPDAGAKVDVAQTITLDPKWKADDLGVVLLVQDPKTMAIVGATAF